MVQIKYDKQSNDNCLMEIYLSFRRNVIVYTYIVLLGKYHGKSANFNSNKFTRAKYNLNNYPMPNTISTQL